MLTECVERRRHTWSTLKEYRLRIFIHRQPPGIHLTCIHDKAKVLVPWILDSFPVFRFFAKKISQFCITFYIEIACHYIATWSERKCESEQLQGGGSLERPWKSRCCNLALQLKIHVGSNIMGITIWNECRLLVMKVQRDFILDGLLIQTVAYIQRVNAFIGEFDIQQRAFPRFYRFTNSDSFEMPVWRNTQNNTHQCQGSQMSVNCKVNEDSYNACTCTNMMKPYCKSTNNESPSNEISCNWSLLYFLESRHRQWIKIYIYLT